MKKKQKEIGNEENHKRNDEKLKLFNGSCHVWLQDDPPENEALAAIVVWRKTKEVPKAPIISQD